MRALRLAVAALLLAVSTISPAAAEPNGALAATTGWTTYTRWLSETLPASLLGAPDVAAPAAGRLEVFGLGSGNAVWGTAFVEGSWTPWHQVGGTPTSDPSAVSSTPGTFDLFVSGTGNALFHATGR